MTKDSKQLRSYFHGIEPRSFIKLLAVVLFLAIIITLAVLGFSSGSNSLILNQISGLISSGISSVEAESGSVSNGATIVSDTSASGGKYIQFGSTATTTTPTVGFQPSAPYYGSFYYMWYKNDSVDGAWSYWTDSSNNPPKTWFSHYIPDFKPGEFTPASELYSSHSYDTFKWQVSKMAESKMEFAIASWWGENRKEDQAFDKIINDFMKRSDNPYPNLRWAIYYENEGFADDSTATIVSKLQYLKKYTASNYFLKVGGKPVIFVYAGANDVPGTMTKRWYDANAQLNNEFYIVLKVFPGYANDSYQPASWHQYAPAVRYGVHAPYSAFVSPGFWLDDGSAERLERNSTDFETAVRNMVSVSATWKLVETWNEWGEGTSVEPGQRVKTVNGNEVIDETAPQFGNLYIDILNRQLPALESGTGR